MKNMLFLCWVFWATFTVLSAQHYWQQRADYHMQVKLDTEKHILTGKQQIRYTNHSPDTLNKLFYHLYYNAFQPNSSMDYRNHWLPDPDKRVGKRIAALQPHEIGNQHIHFLKMDGRTQAFRIVGTILEVTLDRPVLPGKTVELELEFTANIPLQIRRTGRNSEDGIDYSMTQWFPKICAYDKLGWHADPYIGREFHGEFGDFTVSIDVPAQYVIGATGVLQNPEEIGFGYEKKGTAVSPAQNGRRVWRFYAENVHDFAWAADPDYLHDQLILPSGTVVHFLYQPAHQENWKKLQTYIPPFFAKMAEYFGEYPYPVFSFIEGGDGGMEYPMATLITSRGTLEGLVNVAFHEAIHNWFYGVLATNESKYPWMDEGFTHFATDLMMDLVFAGGNGENSQKSNYRAYQVLMARKDRQPLSTHSDWYKRNSDYSLSAYVAGAVYLNQLRYVMGEEAWRKGMLQYYNTWKFKHPDPWDFLRVMEKASGLELDWYHEQFVESLNHIDYSVSVDEKDVIITRVGEFPMPIDLVIRLKNGKKFCYNIPLDIMRGNKNETIEGTDPIVLEPWKWVFTSYRFALPAAVEDVQEIVVDPSGRMADQNPDDNIWTPQGKPRTKP